MTVHRKLEEQFKKIFYYNISMGVHRNEKKGGKIF